MVAGEVFAEETAALGSGGQDVVVAVETAPFGEVVGDVEGGGGGGGVFVVDEGDGFDDGGWGCFAGFAVFVGVDDDVAAEEVAVAEYELWDRY